MNQQNGYYGQQQFGNYHNAQQSPAVVGPQFILSHPITLVLKEKYGSFSGDDFSVKDQNGNLWFRLDSKTWSFRDKRTLLDNMGNPIITLRQKMFTIGKKWEALSPSGKVLFTIESKIFTLTPQVNIYLNDGDRDPDFRLKGKFINFERDFEIIDLRHQQKMVVGNCNKQRAYSSLSAMWHNKVLGKDAYYLNLNPGADAAFCTAICLLLDEFFHDE